MSIRSSPSPSRRKSPSSRRAWIEIFCPLDSPPGRYVALLAEGVDRNILAAVMSTLVPLVALLAEGVDRNQNLTVIPGHYLVALLAEGVDRNNEIRKKFAGAGGGRG